MTAEEFEKVVSRHEMQSLESKECFNVESIEAACAFANAGGGLATLNIIVGLGLYRLRWLFCAVLAVLAIGTLGRSTTELAPAVIRWNADSVMPALILAAGLLLCPLYIFLPATTVRSRTNLCACGKRPPAEILLIRVYLTVHPVSIIRSDAGDP